MNTENELISILAEPYSQNKLIEVLKKYNIPKLEPKEDEFLFFSRTNSGSLQMSFVKEQSNFYLQGMTYTFNVPNSEAIELPFNIKKGDTYETVKDEIGHADFQDDDYELDDPMYRKIWKLKKEDGEIYNLVCRFYSDTGKIESISLLSFNEDIDYEFVKNELI